MEVFAMCGCCCPEMFPMIPQEASTPKIDADRKPTTAGTMPDGKEIPWFIDNPDSGANEDQDEDNVEVSVDDQPYGKASPGSLW